MPNCNKCGGEMRAGREGVCVLCRPSERREPRRVIMNMELDGWEKELKVFNGPPSLIQKTLWLIDEVRRLRALVGDPNA